jgi:hypothetical protein
MNNEILDTEGDAEDLPTVELQDEQGRSLQCYVEKTMQLDGKDYLLLLPVHAPIEIFAWEEDEEDEEEEALVDIEDDEVDEIFDTARAVLSELNLTLQRTAFTLTVSGELPEPQEDDVLTLDLSDEGNEDEASEEFQLLTSFFYEEQEYAICTPYSPLLFFARLMPDGKPALLSPEDFHLVRSKLEEQLFEDLDE